MNLKAGKPAARSTFQRLPYALGNHRRIFIEGKRHRPLQTMWLRDENLHAAPERIGGDERLMRAPDVLPASDDRRLDALAAMRGDALHVEVGDRHTLAYGFRINCPLVGCTYNP
jgi:hypothetical protein